MAGVILAVGCSAQDESRGGAGDAEHVSSSSAALSSCIQESDCSSGLACLAGVCQPCSAHSQCQSDVCDGYAATPLGPGACIPEAEVVYTKANGGPFCDTGDGTRSDPACSIRVAVAHAIGGRYAIRVYPGHYFGFGVAANTVFLFGPGDGSAFVGEEDTGRGVTIEQNARVVLDGLDFRVATLTGVNIQDSDVQLRNLTIKVDSTGIKSTNSTLGIDRVRATGVLHGALQVNGTGSYRITNSYFSGGDFPAVVFSGASSGRFMFNTVTGGGDLFPGGIDCGTTPRVIQDSIVVDNGAGADGAQTVGACSHRRVVVGSGDRRADAGLIKIDPDLDAQGRLLDTDANTACCIDRGQNFVSSLYRDFYGTRRPQGLSNDIGAHETGQVVPASADAHIRTDLDIRRNDNYGCQESMVIGTSRGGGGIPEGGPDAMRALVRFDLTGSPAPFPYVESAVLEMTVDSFDTGLASSLYQVDVHRVVSSGLRTPWDEGNGLEGLNVPSGCANVDEATGVAWAGVGDGGDDNNQSQPDFDAAVAARAFVSQASDVRGTKIRWDITDLVRGWSSGAVPNHGIMLRDVTSDGSFRGVRFGARDGLLRGFPAAVAGPRVIIIRGPNP